MEKFISSGWGKLKFIDSTACMDKSLDKLIEHLKDEGLTKFVHFKSVFGENAGLLCKKGIYSYEWVDSDSKLNYFKGPPPKEDFYSSLRQSGITDEEYDHALNVYKTMRCYKFKDYHDIYLQTDVVLLADVSES